MSFRYMRLILMFDLPVTTADDRRIYRKFHKELIKAGFYMFQYSVYVKLVMNKNVAQQVKNYIKKKKPSVGHVSILEITEKQFGNIEFITGGYSTNVLNTPDKITFYDE